MNDLYDALRLAIQTYMNPDELSPRQKARLMQTYAKYQYDYDTVENIMNVDVEDDEEEL